MRMPRPHRPLNFPAPSTIQRYGKPHHRQHALRATCCCLRKAASPEQTPTASPFFILIYLSQARLILFPASTSTRRRLAAKPRQSRVALCQEVDDPIEPYSNTDEELTEMDVPEPTKPSPEPSKQSGLYGHYKDKVVLRKLGRESDAGTGFPSLGSQ
ncbi:hypothetical protein THAOC_34958 [Thalassiosira oceanica]|uniref:Uncharacterized protein n=1 Tax=Thalassiosira oceanica TaxID=159749 RepID=K0R438_THAOC|nr:hypothetical protein THAOC_34958 [Thalassiosira oceanica]|eukprot:EJK46379.1 hypothetical protein THAOC_34958 [Thalassiosira oceanica]